MKGKDSIMIGTRWQHQHQQKDQLVGVHTGESFIAHLKKNKVSEKLNGLPWEKTSQDTVGDQYTFQ